MLQRGIMQEIDEGVADGIENELLKTLAIVEGNRAKVCELLALYSFRDSGDCLDPYRTEERAGEFSALETSDLATLFTAVLAMPKAGKLIEELGIDKENERKKRLAEAKDTKGSVTCGGVSIYGGVLDHVMQRYGWSLQYALWGITAANLQLLTSDETASLYLTEEERKKVPRSMLGECNAINADDPKNAALVAELLTGKRHK